MRRLRNQLSLQLGKSSSQAQQAVAMQAPRFVPPVIFYDFLLAILPFSQEKLEEETREIDRPPDCVAVNLFLSDLLAFVIPWALAFAIVGPPVSPLQELQQFYIVF